MEILETLLEEAFELVTQAQGDTIRALAFPKTKDMIKVAIGMRRSGKTHFLYQTINQLLLAGVSREQILMINFEDDRLLPMTAKEMGALVDSFYTLYPDNHNRCCYLFFDEVQNVPEWHRVVRRYSDTKEVQIFLTGSSAKLLSKEIATTLRGRSLAVEVWPYDFHEYLTAHNIPFPQKPFGRKSLDIMRHHLLNFFSVGGFPAIQEMSTGEWRETLQGYVDTVVLRDIAERHNLSNIVLLKYLATTLLKNAATTFSFNKFYNDVKSQGFKISKDTIYTYMEYIEDAFLAFAVPFYSESHRKVQNIPKKIYAVDNGLVNATSLGSNAIQNKFLENQVYLDLRRKGKKVYFYNTSDGFEVDFVAVGKDGSRELIQVTLDMSDPKTAQREQRALDYAEKELRIKGRIITLADYIKDGVGY